MRAGCQTTRIRTVCGGEKREHVNAGQVGRRLRAIELSGIARRGRSFEVEACVD